MAVRAGDHQFRCPVRVQRVPVPFLEPGVPQQAAGVHAAQPDVAPGRELRRVRAPERRAQRHATRLLGVRQGRPIRQRRQRRRRRRQRPAEPQVVVGAGRRRRAAGPSGTVDNGRRQRHACTILGHGPVVLVRVQRRPAAARGRADDRRGRGRVDHVPERVFRARVVLSGQVRLHRRIPRQRLFEK